MKYFSIIYCDQLRDCIPYNYTVITVTLCLDYLRATLVFNEFQRGRKWRFKLENLQLCMFACRVVVHTVFSWCGCTSSTRQHVLPIFKILTTSRQERVSSCFIHLFQFLPCWVCVTGMKVFRWRSAFVCKYRRFSASLCCQAASRMLVVCQIAGQLVHSGRLCICMCLCRCSKLVEFSNIAKELLSDL